MAPAWLLAHPNGTPIRLSQESRLGKPSACLTSDRGQTITGLPRLPPKASQRIAPGEAEALWSSRAPKSNRPEAPARMPHYYHSGICLRLKSECSGLPAVERRSFGGLPNGLPSPERAARDDWPFCVTCQINFLPLPIAPPPNGG